MNEKMINVSIAGCSRIAHLHVSALKKIPGVRLAGVWNRSKWKAEIFAETYGTIAYDSVKQMVEVNESDIVIICNAHPFHIGPALEAAALGAHILVEKPLASTLTDCDAIIGAASENHIRLGVISQRRWLEPVKRVRKAIDAGKIGKPVLATVSLLGWRDKEYYDSDTWRGTWKMEGGGVLVNQAPHQLDILLWLLGDVDEVYGVWRNLSHPYIEVEDTAVAVVKFRSGAVGNILLSNCQKPGLYGNVHVHGDNGASVGVKTDGGAMFIAGKTVVAEPPVNDLWTVPGEEMRLAEWIKEDTLAFSTYDPTTQFIKCQLEDFITSVRDNTEPKVKGEDGRRVVELFTGIYRSGRDNMPVRFPLKPEPGLDGRPGS